MHGALLKKTRYTFTSSRLQHVLNASTVECSQNVHVEHVLNVFCGARSQRVHNRTRCQQRAPLNMCTQRVHSRTSSQRVHSRACSQLIDEQIIVQTN